MFATGKFATGQTCLFVGRPSFSFYSSEDVCVDCRSFALLPSDIFMAALIFLPRGFFYLLSFSSRILSCRRLDVGHTSTHDVVLVQI